jgi:hypothetical protein
LLETLSESQIDLSFDDRLEFHMEPNAGGGREYPIEKEVAKMRLSTAQPLQKYYLPADQFTSDSGQYYVIFPKKDA